MIKEKNYRDRELFSELIELPIHLNLIQVVPPFLEESNPVFIIQMSSEAAWKWRVFYWLPRRVFNSLQGSILPDPSAIGLVARFSREGQCSSSTELNKDSQDSSILSRSSNISEHCIPRGMLKSCFKFIFVFDELISI